jgi:glucose/arabinose dehydrogenase
MKAWVHHGVALATVGLGLLTLLTVPAADAASTRDPTVFTVTMRSTGTTFAVATDDPELIAQCRDQLELPVEARQHVNGVLRAGHGGFNVGWSWHLDPDDWVLAEVSIEVCDGAPEYVESELDTWLEDVGRYCPWGSFIAAEGAPGPIRDPSTVAVDLEPLLSGFDQPVTVVPFPEDPRLLVVEQPGTVQLVRDDGTTAAEPFLDVTDRVRSAGGEQGLLGLAFSPRFATDATFFVNYTDLGGDTVVSAFEVDSQSPDRADPTTERTVLTIEQPYANHNGGHLELGPDGMLWIGTGDGGSGGDPQGNAQDPTSLLGKMLRVDPISEPPYAIPEDNPFVNNDGVRSEIWGLGLRNPWRYTFDAATGDLYIADVGQSQWEEVHVEPAASRGGTNWGWSVMEGSSCFEAAECNREPFALPVAEYAHSEGCSITGGVVVRDDQQPLLDGLYLLADYCSGRIWALAPGTDRGWAVAQVGQHDGRLVSFTSLNDGTVVATDRRSGEVLRVTSQRSEIPPRSADGRAGSR